MSQKLSKNKIFIGNLSFKLKESELSDRFSKFGEIVNITMPTDRESGRLRGFAFVEFNSEEAAESALQLNGSELAGRNMVVNLAQERSANRR